MQIHSMEKTILDSLYDGILIADKNTIVRYVNPSYTRITKVESKDIVGKALRKVRPGARLPDVIKTGKPLLRSPRKEGEIEYFVNVVPIYKDHEIIGAVSIVMELSDVYKLTEKLNQSRQRIKNLEKHIRSMNRAKYHFKDIIGADEQSENTKKLARKIAGGDSNVIIQGESGTGKELYAHSIHNESERQEGPFVAVNCAIIDNTLLESELFGYEEGAFTGAKKDGKTGLFELASGGTLFLDEIAELSYDLQAKLLRALQEGSIRRIGGLKEIPIDIRIISATNKNIEKRIQENRFRNDLYYRIAVVPVRIPPLRDRREDIQPLTSYFMDFIATRFKRQISISQDAMNVLYNYDWPGNIRELKNGIEFAANMAEGYVIEVEHLPQVIQIQGRKNELVKKKTLEEIVQETEQREIKRTILAYGNSVQGKKKAAKELGISLATLYNKLNKDNF